MHAVTQKATLNNSNTSSKTPKSRNTKHNLYSASTL